MKYHDIQQNSDDWFLLRLGKFTASTFKNLFAKPTTVAYQKEINRVVFERLTGKVPESFTNDYMQRGTELEPIAREAYEAQKFTVVQNGGFWGDEWAGCSPDGLVEDQGLLEIKCPAFNTMIDYLLKQKLPSEYYYQVHGQMYITDRQWCDFVAFHPDLPIFILRIERSEEVCMQIQQQIDIAITESEKRLIKLKEL